FNQQSASSYQLSVYSASHVPTQLRVAGPAPVQPGCSAGSGPAARATGGAGRPGARDGGWCLLQEPVASGLAAVGRQPPLPRRELLELMITRSSNLATNLLIERVGAARAQASARGLGAWSIQVLRGVEDGKAYRAGLNNTTTARDLGALLAAIAQDRAASPSSCEEMLRILGRQE